MEEYAVCLSGDGGGNRMRQRDLCDGLCKKLPMYEMGFCWVSVAAVLMVVSVMLNAVSKKR